MARCPALIRQRCSSHLGRHLLNGDSGGIVETRLGQTDLQPGVRPQRPIDDIPTAQQQAQQTTGRHHLILSTLLSPLQWTTGKLLTKRSCSYIYIRVRLRDQISGKCYSIDYTLRPTLSFSCVTGKPQLEINMSCPVSGRTAKTALSQAYSLCAKQRMRAIRLWAYTVHSRRPLRHITLSSVTRFQSDCVLCSLVKCPCGVFATASL